MITLQTRQQLYKSAAGLPNPDGRCDRIGCTRGPVRCHLPCCGEHMEERAQLLRLAAAATHL